MPQVLASRELCGHFFNAVVKFTLSYPNWTISQLVNVKQLHIRQFYSNIILTSRRKTCYSKKGGRGQKPLDLSPGCDFVVSCESAAIQQRNCFE